MFCNSFQSQESLTTLLPTTVIPLDDLPASSSKKHHSAATERTKSKLSSSTAAGASKFTKNNQKPIHESEIDMENLPVIQGSFEITKTDADIAQKRSDANQRPASTASLTPNTLKPFFISPASSMKVKSSEKPPSTTSPTKASGSENILEMFLQHQKQQKIKEPPVTAKIEKTNKNGETTITKAHPTTETSASSESFVSSTSSPSTTTTEYKRPQDAAESQINKDLPKLDVSLFTSAPVLDNEPWRPINPSPSQVKANFPASTTEPNTASTVSADIIRSPFNPNPPETGVYRNKFADAETMYPLNDTNDSDSVFYQSFYNPDFSAGDLAIEKLGIADVKPYPLPVNKIDLNENLNEADLKPLKSVETHEVDNVKINYDEDKFEHLGGGVIAKRPEGNDTATSITTATMDENANDNLGIIHHDNETEAGMTRNVTEAPTNLSDIFEELLNLDDAFNLTRTDENKLESRTAVDDSSEELSREKLPTTMTTTTERLNFMNMKEFIAQMQNNKSDEEGEDSSEQSSSLETISGSSVRTTEKPTTTFVEVETLKYTPAAVTVQTTASQPQLFPIISKWEFVNGTQANSTELNITKKVYNETLQALIVENSQTAPPHGSRFDDPNVNRTVDKANLQQLSSIFDTLAAKLGIKPIDVASKMPPFSQQNKLKNNSNRTTATRKPNSKVSSTTPISKQRPRTTGMSHTQRPPTTARTTTATSGNSLLESSSESMVGQAEVEPVDPTKYEEILSLLSSSPVTRITSTTPSLVTLLPVKSNSGIRNFNPRIKFPVRPQLEETRNLETVVKASMSFDS